MTRPILGVMPLHHWQARRATDLMRYATDLINDGQVLPSALVTELFSLMQALERHRDTTAPSLKEHLPPEPAPSATEPSYSGWHQLAGCYCAACVQVRERTPTSHLHGALPGWGPDDQPAPAPAALPFPPACTYHRDGQCRPSGRSTFMNDVNYHRCACQRLLAPVGSLLT